MRAWIPKHQSLQLKNAAQVNFTLESLVLEYTNIGKMEHVLIDLMLLADSTCQWATQKLGGENEQNPSALFQGSTLQ